MDYNYAVKGSEGVVVELVSKDEQFKALSAILETISVSNLTIPKDIIELFPPRAYEYSRTRESFKSKVGVAFDVLGASATASRMTLELLLHPERANRLIQQSALNSNNLNLDDVIELMILNTFGIRSIKHYESEVGHTIRFVILDQLMRLAVNEKSIPQVKAIVKVHIDNLEKDLKKRTDAYSKELVYRITQFRKDPSKYKQVGVPVIPDGSPIGSFQCINN